MEAETPGGADAPKPKDTKDKSVDEQIQDVSPVHSRDFTLCQNKHLVLQGCT